jgi:hypothetical protein
MIWSHDIVLQINTMELGVTCGINSPSERARYLTE